MKPKHEYLIYYFLILVGLFLLGCSDLRDPVPTNSPATLSVHPADWVQVDSSDFHGLLIRNTQWDWDTCQKCHGEDFGGGIAGVACSSCHANIPHPDGWIDHDTDKFHGKAIRRANWQMAECWRCHGRDYKGATTGVSCLTCHPATPEDCTNCHGGVDNLTGAPPEDLDGNSDTTALGVGAHSAHLSGKALTQGIACTSCHVVPDSLYVSGHVDSNLPAELTFSGLALVDNANPQWDRNTHSCMNAYCHGNWSLAKAESNNSFIYIADNIQGNAFSPDWTDPTSAACGTCHNLPPVGHNPFPLDACTNCHVGVVDENGMIVDKTKHINGKVNVFGQEFPMF